MEKSEESQRVPMLMYGAIAILVLTLAFNQLQISSISSRVLLLSSAPAAGASSAAQPQALQSAELQAIVDKVIPKGVPAVYGSELGVSYDKPVESLTVLGNLDGDLNPSGKLKYAQLDAQAQKRYVAMGRMIACEYCCGANALVFPDGQPACGCQHSAAMRGLAMHLLINHPDMSDTQILEEMGKWKTLFFPKQIVNKAVSFASAGMDSNINTLDLTSEEFRDFKAPASGASGAIANAPDMVGGC